MIAEKILEEGVIKKLECVVAFFVSLHWRSGLKKTNRSPGVLEACLHFGEGVKIGWT